MEDKKIKILLADDEADFRNLMTFWLNSKGYAVITAPNGEGAIKLIKDDKPDILLLDLRMPGMHGIEALKKIREFNKELPVIIISGYIEDPETKDVQSYGVSGVFYKGKNFEKMLPLLESALRTHKGLKK